MGDLSENEQSRLEREYHEKRKNERHYYLNDTPGGTYENGKSTRLLFKAPGLFLNIRMKYVLPAGLAGLLGLGGLTYSRVHEREEPSLKDQFSAHLSKSDNGFSRLAAVEGSVKEMRVDIRDTQRQLLELRRELMEQWRWQAMRDRDPERARFWSRRLRALDDKEEGEGEEDR